MKQKGQFLVNFIIRAILGMGLIFFVNQFFAQEQIAIKVGFNAISFLASGFLGLPGVAMLYGIVSLPIL
ncbi:MAG: pro-sigmaK processing inhibitor BofA family protein [Tyzzerella sp.]|nr:pro-sigmaK processing inhibitor BofA family protein [Tyzzerella sp.]